MEQITIRIMNDPLRFTDSDGKELSKDKLLLIKWLLTVRLDNIGKMESDRPNKQ